MSVGLVNGASVVISVAPNGVSPVFSEVSRAICVLSRLSLSPTPKLVAFSNRISNSLAPVAVVSSSCLNVPSSSPSRTMVSRELSSDILTKESRLK